MELALLKKTQIEAGIIEGRVYRKWKSVKKDQKTPGLKFDFFASLWNSRKVKINMALLRAYSQTELHFILCKPP